MQNHFLGLPFLVAKEIVPKQYPIKIKRYTLS